MNGFESSTATPDHNGSASGPLHLASKRPTSASTASLNAGALNSSFDANSLTNSHERMRSGSGEAPGNLQSGIAPWPPASALTPSASAYETFDSYNSHNNHNSTTTACCMSGATTPSHPSSATSSYYYASSAPDSTNRPCKPAPTKIWSNSPYDAAFNGPTQPSDPLVAAAVCHPSAAFAAAAAHANHVAAAAWCNYSPYHQTTRPDSYLTGDGDHRAPFTDSYHPSMRPFTSVGAEQACAGNAVSSYHQSANASQTAAPGKCC